MTALLKPFMPGVKELLDCGDELLERDANHIIKIVADNPELMGDDKEAGLELYLSGKELTLIRKCLVS